MKDTSLTITLLIIDKILTDYFIPAMHLVHTVVFTICCS